MANDIRVRNSNGAYVREYKTEAGATDIEAGQPVKIGGTGDNYVIPLATGEPEAGTDRFVGIAQKASTHTSSADGTISIVVTTDSTELECKATTTSNIDTEAKLLALLNDTVTFDLTSGVYTVDEDEGSDDNVHGLLITGGDVSKGLIYFTVKNSAGVQGSNIA